MDTTLKQPPKERSTDDTYNMGPGSSYYMLFGHDQNRDMQTGLPDVNQVLPEELADEIQITQKCTLV